MMGTIKFCIIMMIEIFKFDNHCGEWIMDLPDMK